MDESCSCRISKIHKADVNFLQCNRYLNQAFGFGRYDVTTKLSRYYNILSSTDWSEQMNDNFVKCAILSRKPIHLFFKVDFTGVRDARGMSDMLQIDLNRSLNPKCVCATQLSQFTIELLQLLCVYGFNLDTPITTKLFDSTTVTYFPVSKDKNGNGFWRDVVLDALYKISNQTCRSFQTSMMEGGGGGSRHVVIHGRKRKVRRVKVHEFKNKHVDMVTLNGILVPLRCI